MWKQRKYDKTKEQILVQNREHKMVARLLAQRNIDINSYQEFLKANYQSLSHPYMLHDVEKAARIFCDNALNKGRVAIIGDYDCDGILSSVMIRELCRIFDLECTVFIPSRLEHGYGLNEKTIQDFAKKVLQMPDLLMITDCGMNSRKEIDMLKEMGIGKIIIVDHHLADKGEIATNADALVTWHLSEKPMEMCACGEVFQLVRGIRWITKRVDPIEFLTYAAIGTIADVSPIVGDNRIIVKNGLTEYAINHVVPVGLHALLKQSNIHPSALTQEDISFKIAPRINAVGRMFCADIVYDLMVERDVYTADKIANYIATYNDERKIEQKKIEIEARKIVESGKFTHGMLVYGKWHIGVVGIVASRLTELYGLPALVIGYNNGVWKGSGRSIHGMNLKDILDSCSEIFDGYGGHAAAAGATLKEEYLDKASQIFNEACRKYTNEHVLNYSVDRYYDAVLKPKAVTEKISEVIKENLYPYCSVNNVEPVFKLSGVNVVNANFIEKDTWHMLKFYVEKDGYKIPYAFKTFTPVCGAEIEGRKINVMFKFPQKIEDPANRFFMFELSIVDIELL